MDNQNGELLRLTLKERDAGAAVLGRAMPLALSCSTCLHQEETIA
jgi:hypothetical protein